MRYILYGIGSLILAVLIGTSVLANISVAPLKIVLNAPPGVIQEGTITVTNLGETPTTVSIQLADFFLDKQGIMSVLEPGTLGEASLSRYLDFSPSSSLSLEPGEQAQIGYRIQLPDEAAGAHWACLVVSEEEPQVVGETQQDGVVLRTVLKLNYIVSIFQNPLEQPSEPWVRVADLRGEIQATEGKEEGEEKGRLLSVSATVENLANVVLCPDGWAEVRDSFGNTVTNKEITEFTILPYAQRILNLQFETADWEAGTYMVLVTIDAGGQTLAANQTLLVLSPI